MEKRSEIYILFVLVLLQSQGVLAAYCDSYEVVDDNGKITESYPPGCFSSGPDYSSGEFYRRAPFAEWDWGRVRVENIPSEVWLSVPQESVPSDFISKIPVGVVDVRQVSDQSKLTSEQLLFSNNFDKADKSKLDGGVLDDVLSLRSGRAVHVEGVSSKGSLGDGGFVFERAGFVQVESVRVSEGLNVRFERGVLKADVADEVEYKGSLSTKTREIEADEVRLSVGEARVIEAGCFVARDVERAQLLVNQSEVVLSGGRGRVVFDNTSGFEYEAAGENSFVAGDPLACARKNYFVQGQRYVVGRAKITVISPKVTEIIEVESGSVAVLPEVGIACVTLSPFSKYFFELDGVRDFGVVPQVVHEVCVRRTSDQIIDCESCSLVDLVSEVFAARAPLTFERQTPIFAASGANASAVLLFSDVFTDVSVISDSPEYVTQVSEQVGVVEKERGGVTHRFLSINPLIKSSSVFVGNYSAYYSDGSLFVHEGVVNYSASDGFEVVVLPPSHAWIGGVVSLLAGFFVFFRRGQVTAWIIIGLLIVFAVGFVLWGVAKVGIATAEVSRSPALLFDSVLIKGRMEHCLGRAVDEALVSLSPRVVVEGGVVSALSNEEAEGVLEERSQGFFESCVKNMRLVEGELVFAPKARIDFLLTSDGVRASGVYPLVAQRGAEQISVDDFTVEKKVRLLRVLEMAREQADAYVREGMFDLSVSQTKDFSLLFFTQDGKVMMRISDRAAQDGPFNVMTVFESSR